MKTIAKRVQNKMRAWNLVKLYGLSVAVKRLHISAKDIMGMVWAVDYFDACIENNSVRSVL